MKKNFYLLLILIGLFLSQSLISFAGPGVALTVSYITSKGNPNTVVVEFSASLDQTSAEDLANYSLNNGATITRALLAYDQKSVILTTSALLDQDYVLTIQNVKDYAATTTIDPVNVTFHHKPYADGTIAAYNLDTLVEANFEKYVIDGTPNKNDGLVVNGPIALTPGVIGNCLTFNGFDNYVSFSPSESFNIIGDQVTISVWVKLDYLPTELSGPFGPIFDSENDQYVIYEDRGNAELRFKATTADGAARPGIPESALTVGEWIYLTGVYDGTNAMIYLNGVLKASLPLTGDLKVDQQATLGKSGTTYFSGSIDQVEVYKRALGEYEILDKLNAKSAPIAQYPLGISSKALTSEVNVYPNPNNGQFTLDVPAKNFQNAKFEVINSQGKVVYKNKLDNQNRRSIDLSSMASGIYVIRLYSENSILNQEFVIK
ncbi:MAG: T9SS type A sorting domain-containing protein [Bacteroidales bacterium]|nr:T9SS type A sorting domain-containing protein [Bacteroidales bacterium]MCB9000087.1 T9SS type A sorting domain-containing protein [Bacteroidales bacterium]MCB9012736.1 T9SS type A sorting domain-containing protein [Bacteroidales bacterium]